MTKYNHLLVIAFSIESQHSTGEDITEQMIIDGLQARLNYLRHHRNEILEACGPPEDTYEVQENE